VLLDARYSLNGAASLRRRHWHERIHGHCARMVAAVGRYASGAERASSSPSSSFGIDEAVSSTRTRVLAVPRGG
jgi:hypothetical protein